jgi:phosphoglycerate kinase
MPKFTEIANATVLVRVCYDLSLQSGDFSRVKDSLPTIKNLLQNQNKVVLLTHWKRPESSSDTKLSTQNLLQDLEREFANFDIPDKINFINQFESFEKAKQQIASSADKLFLLENTRFDKTEKSKNSEERKKLAEKYATLGDFFVDEAFPVSHRKEATNTELAQLLPSDKGFSYAQEIEILSKVKNNPDKPFMAVMAGAKLETKLPLIQKILPKVDKILLGGMLAFTFIKVAKDLDLGINGQKVDTYPELFDSKIDTDFYQTAKDLLINHSQKIVIPIDFEYGNLFGPKEIFDVGNQTIELYKKILTEAKTIFWNGTLGYYEQKPFDKGTIQLAKFVSQLTDCFTVIGGGDTNSAIDKEIIQKFSFASMGGGATLDFLSL